MSLFPPPQYWSELLAQVMLQSPAGARIESEWRVLPQKHSEENSVPKYL